MNNILVQQETRNQVTTTQTNIRTMTFKDGKDLCLNCGKPVNPHTAIWLDMNCVTGEFTDSKEVSKEWEERDENQGAFAFGPDCGPRMLKDYNLCKFKGAGH